MSKIQYRKGYKYQLAADYSVQTPILGAFFGHEFFQLTQDGVLTARKGYAWDGPSGPTFDTRSSLRPSLVHDVLCQAMRSGQFDYGRQREMNALFYQHCIEDGMFPARARIWHAAVELADAGNPRQGPDHPIFEAP